MPKETTQLTRPGLKPRTLDPESSALTIRPPRLLKKVVYLYIARKKSKNTANEDKTAFKKDLV